MTIKEAMDARRISTRRLGLMVGISKTSIHRIVDNGEFPRRLDSSVLKRKIIFALSLPDGQHIEWPEQHDEPAVPKFEPLEEIDLMQLDRSVMQLFGLRANPFINDVETDEDVLRFRGYEAVEKAIEDTIEQRGFLAVIAESGSGKTTIWDGIESVYGNREDTIICKPNVKSREALTPEHLARTLIYGLAGEDVRIRANAEDRGRQLSHALRNIRATTDRKAVLYIDDAHFCSVSVLRQLKTFFEEKIGRFRLLAIILVGLPTLKTKLSEFPEIGNRIRTVEVPPVPVDEYLQFKLQRVGSSIEKVFEPAGLAAFLDRFRQGRRPPLGRPLIINAQCIRAMVRLYANGATPGERITREIVDSLPGEAPARKAAA